MRRARRVWRAAALALLCLTLGPLTVATAASPPDPATQPDARGGEAKSQRALIRRVIAYAKRQKGKRYCWGGTGPRCYDCSGLVYAAYRSAGRKLPRSSTAMARGLPRVPLSKARPGDILWRPGHVGIYLGKGWAIHAPGRGKRVKLQRSSYYRVALRPGPKKPKR